MACLIFEDDPSKDSDSSSEDSWDSILDYTFNFSKHVGFSMNSKQRFKELIFDLFVEYSLLCSTFEEFNKFLDRIFKFIKDNISNFWSKNFHEDILKVISHVNNLGISQFGESIWNDSYILQNHPQISFLNIFIDPMGYILNSDKIQIALGIDIKSLLKKW